MDVKSNRRAVVQGVLMLSNLNLRFGPNTQERFAALTEAWLNTVPDGIAPERLEAAFSTLRRECVQWPAPKDLIAAMPPEISFAQEYPKVSASERERLSDWLTQIEARG